MPKILKQTPRSREVVHSPTRNGSVLAEAIPVEDILDDYIKMVIYGYNRTGKTYLACQFPKPLLLISFDPGQSGGARTVKKVPGVTFLHIQSTEKAIALGRELQGNRDYKTHVLDTVTSLQDIVLQELLGLDEVPVQLNWGTVTMDQYRERSEKTKEILLPFRGLPAHTVFVAQEKDHNPPESRTTNRKLLTTAGGGGLTHESFFAADLGSAAVKWMHDGCDFIGRLYIEKEVIMEEVKNMVNKKEVTSTREVETGKIVRRLRTMFHPNFAAGFRSERPETIPEFIDDPTFEKIYDLIKG